MTRRLPCAVETVCYRLVQEALTNVMRCYAWKAKQVWITLSADQQQVSLSVIDDGRGFDVKEQPHSGLGLFKICGSGLLW
ncbi:MAG: ATP-binding protein [Anaerolineae bacterium]